LIISIGDNVDKKLFECFQTKDFSEILKESYKDITYSPVRNNILYINFDDLKNSRDLRSESELKPYLKKIFKKITMEIAEYFSLNEIYPFDYKNLKSKSLFDYIKYKLKCKTKIHQIPEYLIKSKNEILIEIFKMGFDLSEVESAFDKFPTFDKQYIFDVMNKRRLYDHKKNNQFNNDSNNKILNNDKNRINTTEEIKLKNENNYKDETTDLKCIILKDRTQYIQIKKTNNDNILHKLNKEEILKMEKKKKFSEIYCNICKDKKINIVFGDCKHKYLCEECLTNKVIFCPICKNKIKKFIKLYKI